VIHHAGGSTEKKIGGEKHEQKAGKKRRQCNFSFRLNKKEGSCRKRGESLFSNKKEKRKKHGRRQGNQRQI